MGWSLSSPTRKDRVAVAVLAGALLLASSAQIAASAQHSTSLSYGDSTRPALPTLVTDPLGRVSQAAYFANGIPSSVSSPVNPLGAGADALSSVTTLQLNSDELPSLVTDAMGHQQSITYNRDATVTSRLVITLTHLADNTKVILTLDAEGKVVEHRDERFSITHIDYSRAGLPLRVIRGYGTGGARTTTYTYDSHMDVSAIDPPGGTTRRVSFDYRRYVHGSAGAPPTLASPVVYEGQVTRIDYPDGTYEIFGYDASEQLDWRYGQDGRYTEVQRDALHRITSVTYPAVSPWAAITVTTDYDEFGRVEQTTDASGTSTFTYDSLNRLTSATPGTGQGVTYTYTPDLTLKRWLTTVSLSGVGGWQFGEDGKGREAQVLNPFGQLTQRKFDPDGKAIQELRANGTVTNYAYNGRDWLSSIQHLLANGTNLDTLTYSRTDAYGGYADNTGRIRQETDSGGQVHKFGLSAHHYELVNEDHPDFGVGVYQQDGNGNFTRRTVNGVNTYFGYDVHNKLLWVNTTNVAPTTGQASPYRKYSYNANGEPTTIERRATTASPVVMDTLEWDGMGKLRKVVSGGTTVYTATYDGAGDRVQAVLNGTTHTYSYGAGLLYDSAGSTVYTPGVSHRQNGVDSYYHEDWIGSTRYTTDSTGLTAPAAQRWDAYGNLTASAGGHGGSLRWVGGPGYEADGPLGMSLLGARYYDPAVGRFLNADPIGIAGGINQFGYCGGDPVNAVDPSGLLTFEEAAAWTLRAPGRAGTAVWKGFMSFWQVKLEKGTPRLGTGNPDSPTAAALRARSGEISDAMNEMYGGIMLPAVAGGAVAAYQAGGPATVSASPLRVRHHTDSVALKSIEQQGAIRACPRSGGVDVELPPYGPMRTAADELGAANGNRFANGVRQTPGYVEFDAPGSLQQTYAVSSTRNTGTIPTRGALPINTLRPKYVTRPWWKFWVR